MQPGLRLLDLGWVSPLRSQTAWHAIAEVAAPGALPTFSMCSPTGPYVSIGYHRRLDEIDLEACARRGLSVFRRRVGGGPVYCDASQLFFQLIVPAAGLPAVMDRAWERAMDPAVAAFRTLGAKAELAEGNDIVADDRKICGTGAGRIGDAMVFVGNVIFDFDHEAMADTLRVTPAVKEEVARLTQVHLGPIGEVAGRVITRGEAVAALVDAYAEAFGPARRGTFSEAEAARARETDALFASSAWVDAERAPVPSRIKVRAGVAVLLLGSTWVSVADGVIDRVGITDAWLKPRAARDTLARALAGAPLDPEALRVLVRETCPTWARAEEFVGSVLSAYRGGA